MEELVKQFLDGFTSKHTKSAYERDIYDFFDNRDELSSLTVQDFIDYRDSLIKKGLAPTTINRRFSGLSSFLDFCISREKMDKNPIKGIKLPRASVTNPTQAFTDEEVKSVLKLAIDEKHKLILLLLFNCGIRRSELLMITKSDISFNGTHTVLRIFGKGGKIREIPLNESVKSLLLKYVAKVSGSILFNEDPSTIYRIVRDYSKKAGIDRRLSPHSCRATAITKALEQNVPITDVADFAGHGDITTTQVYWKRRRGLEESPAYKLNYE